MNIPLDFSNNNVGWVLAAKKLVTRNHKWFRRVPTLQVLRIPPGRRRYEK
ncbi:hypothetical protein [Kamptonema sp. UHCC 0994]|nr:hypothetical protein [Kamptonema sp. UHCC 0994]